MHVSQHLQRALCATGLCLAVAAPAQMVYRIQGPDGKVTFSDKPPVTEQQGKVVATGLGAAAAASGAGLPFELRQAVGKHPVTLYTAQDCSPCASGRVFLSKRGIPFAERTVTSAEDAVALKQLTGENSVPVLGIGAQRLKGYSATEWAQSLDAAGYPATSLLPTGYRQAPASPLGLPTEKTTPEKTQDRPTEEAVTRPAPGPSNPAGIKF